MIMRAIKCLFTAVLILASSTACDRSLGTSSSWQEVFSIASCNLLTTGRNGYFVMEPGFQTVLADDEEKVQITVLDETRTVDGVLTRVIEEREWVDGELHEISRNYFAMCETTKDVFYFGEDVDYYKDGKVINHDGSWLAGTGENRAGLIMPGAPSLGMKYYQEIAPGVAMDRAEIVSLDETCRTPAGTFSKCMKVEEGSALSVFEKEYKYYAPDVGLIRDEDLTLVKYGFITD